MMNSIQRFPGLHKVSLRSLRAFEAAYLSGSFAAAAEDLCVTASAVSHAIQTLESTLGVVLFERRQRRILPTDTGMRLFEVLHESFLRINEELMALLERNAKVRPVTLQCSPSFAAIWMMPRLPAFLQAHPDIDLRISALHAPADFRSGLLDLAIVYGAPVNAGDLWVEPIDVSERYVPLCSPALVQDEALPLAPDRLSGFQLFHNETSLVSWRTWTDRYMARPGNAERGLRFDRSFMMLDAVANGLGMCLDSTLLAREHLQRGTLVMPFGDMSLPVNAHHLCIPSAKVDLPKVRKVVSWITSWR